MPQQPSSLAFFDSAPAEFTVKLRGYDPEQVNNYIARLKQTVDQTRADKDDAEKRLGEAQRPALLGCLIRLFHSDRYENLLTCPCGLATLCHMS